MKERVKGTSLELARNGEPKKPFYLTGTAGGKSFSVHAEGDRIYLTQEGSERREIDLKEAESLAREAEREKPLIEEGSPHDATKLEEDPVPGRSALDAPKEEGDEHEER